MKSNAIRTSVDLPRDLHRRVHEAAARKGCSARKLILARAGRAVEETKVSWPSRRLSLDQPMMRPAGRRISVTRAVSIHVCHFEIVRGGIFLRKMPLGIELPVKSRIETAVTKRLMSSLNFPDIKVWLAMAAPEHIHAAIAKGWWGQETGSIAICRLTQLGFLRLMTSAAVMDGKPLTMAEAWHVFDRLYDDDRVTFISEPLKVDKRIREKASRRTASPKVWVDAWLLTVAHAAEGTSVAFDKALAA